MEIKTHEVKSQSHWTKSMTNLPLSSVGSRFCLRNLVLFLGSLMTLLFIFRQDHYEIFWWKSINSMFFQKLLHTKNTHWSPKHLWMLSYFCRQSWTSWGSSILKLWGESIKMLIIKKVSVNKQEILWSKGKAVEGNGMELFTVNDCGK